MKKMLLMLVCCLVLLPLFPLADGPQYTVGIAQFATHGSLDNCRDGFIQGLAEAGIVEGVNLRLDVQNANADVGLSAIIAGKFVAGNYDLICAIATPIAIAAVNTSDGKIPVIYTAVSAPIQAGLAYADRNFDGNATGTSDQIPVRDQLALIRALQPQAGRLGILYTSGEVNSQVQAALYQEMALDFGFELVLSTVSSGADIPLVLPGLMDRVDAITMLTDNNVVQHLDVVLDMAEDRKLPVYGSEVEQVINGCVAAVGIDYLELGRQSGLMAARVLTGEPADSIPYLELDEFFMFYNEEVLTALGLELPEALAGQIEKVGAAQ